MATVFQSDSFQNDAFQIDSGAVTHGTDGGLSTLGAVVAASATRTHIFSSVSVLSAAGALVSGAATRSTTLVTHAADGSLTTYGAVIAAAAQRLHEFVTSGALSTDGAGVSAAADHGSFTSAKSGVSRQWLIDYYTQAFEKTAPLPAPVTGVAKLRGKSRKVEQERVARAAKVDALVTKAEADVAKVLSNIADNRAAAQFTYNLKLQAQAYATPDIDFAQLAESFNRKLRQDDEDLLLLASVL